MLRVAAAQPESSGRPPAVDHTEQDRGPLDAGRVIREPGPPDLRERKRGVEGERAAGLSGGVQQDLIGVGGDGEGVVPGKPVPHRRRPEQRRVARRASGAHAPELQLPDARIRRSRNQRDRDLAAARGAGHRDRAPALLRVSSLARPVHLEDHGARGERLHCTQLDRVREGEGQVKRRHQRKSGGRVAVDQRRYIGARSCDRRGRESDDAGRWRGALRPLRATHDEKSQPGNDRRNDSQGEPPRRPCGRFRRQVPCLPASQTRYPLGAGAFPKSPTSPWGWP